MLERELYSKVGLWLDGEFGASLSTTGRSLRVVHDVSNLDWLPYPGKWMRPDLALVHVHRSRFSAIPTLNLHTFEVKTKSGDLLQGLHQTLAHSRFAEFVYLVAPSSAGWNQAIIEQAERFGVGIVSFDNAENFTTGYRVLHTAARNDAIPELREQFLEAMLSDADRLDNVLEELEGSRN